MHGDGNNRKKKQCSWWCAACGGQYDWRAPNRVLVIQDSVDPCEASVFRAHAAPQGLCDNLINSLKLLTNQQRDGDSPVGSIVKGFRVKKSHRFVDGQRTFIKADYQEAVNLGGVRQGTKSVQV